MAKENKKSCTQCWQYCEPCETCKLGWCCWFTCRKKPHCAEECKAFNPFSRPRKHRDEHAEIFPLVEEFYDFLQGKSVPKGFVLSHKPKLTANKAFTIIYILQEYLHVLPDSFEQCDGCNCLFDTDGEGFILTEEYTLNNKPLPKKYRGHWCDNCIPGVDFQSP